MYYIMEDENNIKTLLFSKKKNEKYIALTTLEQ